jgi:hypothetical protein
MKTRSNEWCFSIESVEKLNDKKNNSLCYFLLLYINKVEFNCKLTHNLK